MVACWVKGEHVEVGGREFESLLSPTPHLAELFTVLCVLAISRGLHYVALRLRQHDGSDVLLPTYTAINRQYLYANTRYVLIATLPVVPAHGRV